MQMSYLYVSNLPFKNFCKLAKRAETIRNYQKQVLVMIKHWIKTTDSRPTSFIQPRNRYSWTLCTLRAVKETPGYASILGRSISLASLFIIHPAIFWLFRQQEIHSSFQTPHSFWSAPRIATSEKVHNRKSTINDDYTTYAAKIGPSQRSRFFLLIKIKIAQPLGTRMQEIVSRKSHTIVWVNFCSLINTFHSRGWITTLNLNACSKFNYND